MGEVKDSTKMGIFPQKWDWSTRVANLYHIPIDESRRPLHFILSSRDVRPRGLASASRPKNLASASASASWVVASASASASWVLASASWVLASSLEASRGQQPKRNGMWLEVVNHHEFPEVSHAAAIRKLVLHLA